MTDCPRPGLYPNVPFADYLAWPAVSNSLLGISRRSPAHARAYLDGRLPLRDTAALRLGTMMHSGVLEPLQIPRRYVVMPQYELTCRNSDGSISANPKNTKAYRNAVAEFKTANVGKEVVDEKTYCDLLGVAEAIGHDPSAGEWLRTGGKVEVALVWIDDATGLTCKGRIDYLDERNARFVDLKTTRDGRRFDWAITNFGYDRQAAFYRAGLKYLTQTDYEACIVAVETEVPWCVRAAPLGFSALAAGQREYRRLLDLYAECERSGHWPGYESPESWETDLGLGGDDGQSIGDWINKVRQLTGVSQDDN